MTIVAQDPLVRDADGRILTAQVPVPIDLFAPGPWGHRVHVIDYDATRRWYEAPVSFVPTFEFDDAFVGADDNTLLTNSAFHAQNVYAIASRTLAVFEQALGRRSPWSFAGHALVLAPHAFVEQNAYYSDDDQALLFGYFPGSGDETVYTCLSHDIVAHETTHAVLDGLRRRYLEPSLPDQPAFHEAFADIVALLSVFSVVEVVQRLLGDPDAQGRIAADKVSVPTLKQTALVGLAEQMGDEVYAERGNSLRRSVELDPSPSWRTDPKFLKSHRRGEVLVAAVMQTLLRMWVHRLAALIHGGGLDLTRAAEEGAKSAGHLLTMLIRAIDYLPPVDFRFEDFLEAIFVSDSEIAPDDAHEYRDALVEAFALFGIERPAQGLIDMSAMPVRPLYEHLHSGALRTDPDEIERFIWQNASLLGLNTYYYTNVESVRPAVRVGPDGFVVNEFVADYVQLLNGTPPDLRVLGLTTPPGMPDDTKIQLLGGGVLVFDEWGGLKFHHPKPLFDWARQDARLAFLFERRLTDTHGRFGFSLGTPRGQSFAAFHTPDQRAEEDW